MILFHQAIAVSSVKHSCESILESFVSRYENHFDVRRSVDEETANEEFAIAVTGPNLANCDGVVREAMEKYWREKGAGTSIRTSVLEQMRPDRESVVIQRMLKTNNILPFMN